eukprot:928527-Amphidinium_carterae.1
MVPKVADSHTMRAGEQECHALPRTGLMVTGGMCNKLFGLGMIGDPRVERDSPLSHELGASRQLMKDERHRLTITGALALHR